jgi:type II secretory pathway pseudopilin PulG
VLLRKQQAASNQQQGKAGSRYRLPLGADRLPLRRRSRRQSGYMLLAILLMMALMVIAATAVAPRLATQIKREREQELIHRGTEYAKAIRRFYRKFGRYPTSIDQLEQTNNFRFLRKRYKDPITGKDDWKLIHFGEAKNALNLFGAPSSGTGSSVTGGGGMSAPGFSGTPQTPAGMTPAGSPAGQNTSGSGRQPGQPTSGSSGSSGPTFGGGPIIGVVSTSETESLIELQGKTHYNEWEFVYDPRYDRQGGAAGGGVGLPGMPPGQGSPATAPGQGTPAPPAGGLPGMGGPPKPP